MYPSFHEAQEALSKKETSCTSLVEYYLNTISEKKHLNAFLEVFADEALERAAHVDQKIADGTAGTLAGLVIGIKDTIVYKDHKVSASSKILEHFESVFSATAVERLLAEDAIIIGRQNCDEFAMGASNETSAFGNVLNAADESRVPGGSSGGSAVAVQADMCMASLGSDTGGSVRQPAAFTGTVGMKPTYSRVSRWGLIAYASSFDQIGVISKNIADNALILETIAGSDEYDATASLHEVGSYTNGLNNNKKYKVAYIKDCIEVDHLQEEIKTASLELLENLKQDGHQVTSVDFPYLDYMVPTYYLLTTAEASSNLSRYDGIRYGYRTENASSLEGVYKKSRSEGFGKEVQRRIMLGTFTLSASYYDAYYTKAQKVRKLIKTKTEELLQEYDFIISPTTPTTAFKIGENTQDPLKMYLADIFTVQASLAGMPAISIPYGKDKNNLPIGIQIMTKAYNEAELYAFCSSIEQSSYVSV